MSVCRGPFAQGIYSTHGKPLIQKHCDCPLYIKDSQVKIYKYGKCSKISNTLLFLFSNKILVIKPWIHEMLVRIVNMEDPDQIASSEAVWSGSALFV